MTPLVLVSGYIRDRKDQIESELCSVKENFKIIDSLMTNLQSFHFEKDSITEGGDNNERGQGTTIGDEPRDKARNKRGDEGTNNGA